MKTLLTTATLLLALCAAPLRAGEVPFLTGRVVDNAGLLSPGTRHDLETVLASHEDSTTNQVVVLTVPDLGGEEIETFALRVAETWKLGRKDRDNGVLLLVARDDRAVRIEVGRGLEGDLPDITCGIIIRKEILPHFRDGDFDAGVRSGVTAILGAIGGSYVADDDEAEADMPLLFRLAFFLFFLFVVGIFTATGILVEGGFAWFLYVFLIPFWGAFPSVLLGPGPGIGLLLLYLIGFPLARWWFARSPKGKALAKKWAKGGRLVRLAGGSSGGRWSSGGFSSRSGGFSGGGGGFSGGGASGRW